MRERRPQPCLLIALFLLLFTGSSLRANVYATDIRLNGSLRATAIAPGGTVTISYILNDYATAGVSVEILQGSNVVKTFTSAAGEAGTNAGLNTVVWDGTWDQGTNNFQGVCTVRITARSTGYGSWTNITDDGPQFDVSTPTGIAVNRNTNSPYYGRVFVSVTVGMSPNFGICKFNADGSPGDEGGFSTGGLSWGAGLGLDQYFSPWKIAISADDKVCVDDFSGQGVVYGFDQEISTNSCINVVRMDNYPASDPDPLLSGLRVTGSGTNAEIWMSDDTPLGGIIRWQLTDNGTAATNDMGTIIAPVTNASPMSSNSYDLDIASNGLIYTTELLANTNTGADPVICFPPFEGTAETNAEWTVPFEAEFLYIYGIAVDPTATVAALAIHGPGQSEDQYFNPNLQLLNAATGAFITNLDQVGGGIFSGDIYSDVAWDSVGNLYAADQTSNVWRAYSPPGPNEATTVAAPFIQEYPDLLAPTLSNPQNSTNGLNFVLTGQSSVAYIIQQSSDLVNWIPVATNTWTNAVRRFCIPFADQQDFYRAVAVP